MSEVYKKFTVQDYAVIPFNAHKQYDFTSASAATNSVNHFNSRWTSESMSNYSTHPDSASVDTINTLKYNQIDHLFYRNFKKDISNKFGDTHYLLQKRDLHEKANIISIPAGLYGHEVKPGSFYLSSSIYEIVDDSKGNLIISGSTISNYPTDIRSNVFRIGPVKGFRAHDLSVFNGYVQTLSDPQHPEEGVKRLFWRRGETNPNASTTYTTPSELKETDDSYYFNKFRYNKCTFVTSSLGSTNSKFSAINFDSVVGSYITSPHNEKFNFNDEDFSVSFNIRPQGTQNLPVSIGQNLGGGYVFSILGGFAYIAYPVQVAYSTTSGWGPMGISVGNTGTNIGDGEQQTVNMITAQGNNTNYLGDLVGNGTFNGYSDWWVPNFTEVIYLISNLDPKNNSNFTINGSHLATSEEINLNYFNQIEFTNNVSSPWFKTTTTGTFPIRKMNISNAVLDSTKRYIISKSTTKTIIPALKRRKSSKEPDKPGILGSSQPQDVLAEPQYPFEIYMSGSLLYFDRSDGDTTVSIKGEITASGTAVRQSHILCQKSGSTMEIWFDGTKITSGTDTTSKQTQNTANLYIGAKGLLSKNDAGVNSPYKFFNGELSQINIWENAFTSTQIANISESINSSPYVGNIFYRNGFATITHPKYQDIASGSSGDGTIHQIKFQGSHLIWENEYQCTVDEHEYNSTLNISARKINSSTNNELADFATGSLFKPYVTTIGLYSEDNELLVVGKLGQPVRMSNETDTTFVLRWDT